MSEYKECPYCAEQILAIAIKCKHCKSMLSEANSLPQAPAATPSGESVTVRGPEIAPPPPPPQVPTGESVTARGPEIAPPPAPPQPAVTPAPPAPAEEAVTARGPEIAPPPPPPQAAVTPPPQAPAAAVKSSGSDSFNLFIKAVSGLFRGDDISASRLSQIESVTSLIILAAAALAGPLLSTLVLLIKGGIAGAFGYLFLHVFVASSLSNLLSFALLVGLLYGWFEIKKEKAPINAHLSVTAIVALIMFVTVLLNMITMVLPWTTIAYMLIALIIFKYFSETFQNKKVLESFAVLAIWLIIERLVINQIIQLIF